MSSNTVLIISWNSNIQIYTIHSDLHLYALQRVTAKVYQLFCRPKHLLSRQPFSLPHEIPPILFFYPSVNLY